MKFTEKLNLNDHFIFNGFICILNFTVNDLLILNNYLRLYEYLCCSTNEAIA